MKTIKIYNIVLLLCVVGISCLGSMTYIPFLSEGYQPAYLEDPTIDRGYAIVKARPLTDKKVFFKELDIDTLEQMITRQLPASKEEINHMHMISNDNTAIRNTFQSAAETASEKLLTILNSQLDIYDKFTPNIQFRKVAMNYKLADTLSPNDINIVMVVVLHRQTKQHGIVCEVLFKADKSTSSFVSLVKVKIIGTIPEDKIVLLGSYDINQSTRQYGTSSDFAKDEQVVQDIAYEKHVITQQVEGLLQDRGISSLSFFKK